MADRVLLIEEKIGLDLNVDIPRPRRTSSAKLAELEAEVLDRVMKRGKSESVPRLFSRMADRVTVCCQNRGISSSDMSPARALLSWATNDKSARVFQTR